MRAEDIRLLFDHVYWVRDRIMAAAANAEEDFIDSASVTIRDLRSTLVHELDVEWSWRERLRGIPFETWGPDGDLKPSSYPDVSALAAHWHDDEATMREWLAGLSDDDVTGSWDAEGPGGCRSGST